MLKIKIMATATLALSMVFGWGRLAIAANDMVDKPDMDHRSMGEMNHSQMGHETLPENIEVPNTNHSMHEGEAAPAGARDPHAYSGGINFGHMPSHQMADDAYIGGLRVDRLESAQSRDRSFNAYELQGWYGKDYNRLVLKAEGEMESKKLHDARTELLWSHALDAYWNTQLGARYDNGGLAPDRKWLALGVQGLTPYWFGVSATAYIGEQGRTALRLGAEYELLLTQKLILQPRFEVDFHGRQDTAGELGSGLTSMVSGMRMRYEIFREFAPYIGVEWSGKFGGTADYARANGLRTNETRVVAGVRFWY